MISEYHFWINLTVVYKLEMSITKAKKKEHAVIKLTITGLVKNQDANFYNILHDHIWEKPASTNKL